MYKKDSHYLRSITDHTADALITIDDRGVIKDVNPACLGMFGYSSEELIGSNVKVLMAADIAAQHDHYIAQYNRTGERHIIGTGRFLEAQKKNGTLFPIHLSVTKIELENQTYFSGVIKDESNVIDRVSYERGLKEKKLLERAETYAKMGHWEVDMVHNKLFWSDTVYEIHGLDKDTYQPDVLSAIELYHPDDRAAVRDALEDSCASQNDFVFEARIILPDGSMRYVLSSGEPMISNETGEVIGIFGIFRDMTEDKRREQEKEEVRCELERSNKDLEEFAFTVSHDLKAPLRHISMSADLLASTLSDEDLTAEQHEFINIMVDGANRAQFMVDSLLEYSRIGSHGDMQERVDLNNVLEEVQDILALDIKEINGKVHVEHLPTIRGDRGLFIHMFQNLIANALKYVAVGVVPNIRIYSEEGWDGYKIFIEDNGIGIKAEFADKIFRIFQRLHSDSSPYKGMGIGLSICMKIMRAHGGMIELDPDYTEGARFVLIFPLQEA